MRPVKSSGRIRVIMPAHYSMPDSRRVATRGGKSGLHRAECQLTAGRREATESGTESKTADGLRAQVRVKRCGKSAPGTWQQGVAG